MKNDQIVKSAQILIVLMVAILSHEGISSADDSDGKAVQKVSLWVPDWGFQAPQLQMV